jgi:hypothetical protein
MPYMTNGKRDVAKQNRLYDSKPEARARRAEGVKIQRELEKKGKASKGDGLDNAHKVAASKGGGSSLDNIKLESPSKNRSFARTSASKVKSEKSKRER